jgi:hypothetical protein
VHDESAMGLALLESLWAVNRRLVRGVVCAAAAAGCRVSVVPSPPQVRRLSAPGGGRVLGAHRGGCARWGRAGARCRPDARRRHGLARGSDQGREGPCGDYAWPCRLLALVTAEIPGCWMLAAARPGQRPGCLHGRRSLLSAGAGVACDGDRAGDVRADDEENEAEDDQAGAPVAGGWQLEAGRSR